MTTITRFTKEQLQQIIETDHVQCGEASALARIALASLEAETVDITDDMAYAFHHALSDSSLGAGEVEDIKAGLRAAFSNVTAPPAPVVRQIMRELVPLLDEDQFARIENIALSAGVMPPQPVPEEMTMADAIMEIDAKDADRWTGRIGFQKGWNAFRAAMLQGKAEPVSNRDELPLNYLQGHKDGLEWGAQLAEANHPQTGDWLYDDPVELAKAIRKGPDMPPVEPGNSPVISDGYALVPIDATRAMIDAAARVEEDGYDAMHKAMIAAAPQQEAE